MKKIIAIILLTCAAVGVRAQIKLSDKDFNNLVSLANLYSHNNMCTGEDFLQTANSLRTPVLNHVIDVMLAIGRADSNVVEKRFLAKPGHDELMLWYAIRKIHYNRIDTPKTSLTSAEVAKNVLSENIDERWLVHNYYYLEYTGLAMYFNHADLSNVNIEIDSLNLKDQTEKGIFFLNITKGLIEGRFLVLQSMKKNDRIIEFARKMPKFNGKPYYYYTDLDFPDFDWSGYKSDETYKQMHIGGLMSTLAIHFSAIASIGDKNAARDLYFNSILYKPDFFKYSKQSAMLQKIYDGSK